MAGIAFDRSLVQELFYNGYRFNDSTKVLHYNVNGNKSPCGRFYSDHHYTLTVEFYEAFDTLAGGDRQMDYIVERLTAAAGPLRFSGRAFGTSNINLQGGKKDTRFGPWPRIDSMVPVGSGRVVKVTWTIEWDTVSCADGVTEGLFPLEFVWDCAFKYDKAGNETRTITGHLAVPATRFPAKARKLPYTADELRERLLPPLPKGYERTTRDFRLDYAKTKISFTIEDRQIIGAILPANVIEGSAARRLSQTPGKPLEWSGSYQAEYHIAPGRPITAALTSYFLELEQFWSSWVARVPLFGAIAGAAAAAAGGVKPVLRPWSFELADPVLYGGLQRVAITAQFRVYAVTLRQMLELGGLWVPLPRANNAWEAWAASVPAHHNARGINNVVFTAGDDSLNNLCQPASFEVDLRNRPTIPRVIEAELRTDGKFDNLLKRLFPKPTPSTSWMEYRQGVHVESESGKVIGKVLPTAPLTAPQQTLPEFDPFRGVLPQGTGQKVLPPSTDVAPSSSSNSQGNNARGGTYTHQRTAPTIYVTLDGGAVRCGFPIPEPSILSYGGAPVEDVGRADAGEGFRQEVVGADAMGNPVYVARWRKRYVVVDADKRPARIIPQVPANPFYLPVI